METGTNFGKSDEELKLELEWKYLEAKSKLVKCERIISNMIRYNMINRKEEELLNELKELLNELN